MTTEMDRGDGRRRQQEREKGTMFKQKESNKDPIRRRNIKI